MVSRGAAQSRLLVRSLLVQRKTGSLADRDVPGSVLKHGFAIKLCCCACCRLFVKPRIEAAMKELAKDTPGWPRALRYVGRPASASVATASLAIHKAETQEILRAALAL